MRLRLVSAQVLEGSRLFFNERFGGNRRTCGTCHPMNDNLTISPADAAGRRSSDPLFAPSVPGLELPAILRRSALILENQDGFHDPTVDFNLRAVQHCFSLATTVTGSNGERTGWSGDGAPGGPLRNFATGAVIQHFTKSLQRREGVDFRLPTPAELDAIEAFMRSLGRLDDLNLDQIRFRSSAAARGRDLFQGKARCNQCHSNAGANAAFSGRNENFDTGVEGAGIDDDDDGNEDDGLGTPGDGTFNTPPLVEAADTAPFFHDHAARTLMDAINFYRSADFADSPSGRFFASQGTPVELNDAEAKDVEIFLRVLNGAFNLSLAEQRFRAAQRLSNRRGDGSGAIEIALWRAGIAEVEDALRVLGGISGSARSDAFSALRGADDARRFQGGRSDDEGAKQAVGSVTSARKRLGSGMDFRLGEGNLAVPLESR